jgi:hypothetical protein
VFQKAVSAQDVTNPGFYDWQKAMGPKFYEMCKVSNMQKFEYFSVDADKSYITQ